MRNNEPLSQGHENASVNEPSLFGYTPVRATSTGSQWEKGQLGAIESSSDRRGIDVLTHIVNSLAAIQRKLEELTKKSSMKDWYSTHEAAERLGKAEYTVREWCRHGQCRAEKRKMGRGGKRSWMISHAELLRLDSEGPSIFR